LEDLDTKYQVAWRPHIIERHPQLYS
jgi:hypothetical protein